MIAWALEEATAELRAGEAPEGLLCPAERELFEALRVPKRRADWLLGRSVVKKLCRARLRARGGDAPLCDLAVVPAPDGSPRVLDARGEPLPITVSLSHRAGLAAAALCEGREAPLGVDIELVETRSPGFASDFFTEAEAICLAHAAPWDRSRVETEIWSLKEATLKALRVGLRVDTRTVEVRPRAEARTGWAEARLVGRDPAKAFVRDVGGFVLALVWLGRAELAEPLEEVELR